MIVRGRVQGVYFRAFTQRQGRDLGVSGYARNLPGGRTVEVVAEGPVEKLNELLERLRGGPPGAVVEEVETHWGQPTHRFADFSIRY